MKEKLNDITQKIHRMGLGSVAIFFLESLKPLNNLAFNLGVFSIPFVEIFLKREIYEEILALVRDNEAWEYLIKKLEEMEDGMADMPG